MSEKLPHPRVAVIGAGMSGLLCGIKLREAGIDDFTIYEKADRIGGTWRENTYPGLSCDVPSHLYTYSFAPNPDWSQMFSPGEEIQAYLERVKDDHGLESVIEYGQEVVRCELREGRWQLETAAGLRDEVDFVICATGVLHHPNYPELEGLDSFAGAAFHSARWDHSVELDGKRVGVIGTGSTAIQIVGALVERSAELRLFQRTAQWVFPQVNPAYSEEDKDTFRGDPSIVQNIHKVMSERFSIFSNAVVDASSDLIQQIQETCLQNLQTVKDPELREKLTPDYRAGCKRLVMSGEFYDAIQQPGAQVITSAIERVEPAGVRTADGELHELDVLVLATGFRAHQFMRPMNVVGRDGRALNELWARTARAYRSISVPDFPNFFMMIGPSSPIGNFSLIEIAELQFSYILQLIDLVREGRFRQVSARPEATERFNSAMADASKNTIWVTGCRSWYLDESGLPASWPWTFARFQDEMSEPLLSDFELEE